MDPTPVGTKRGATVGVVVALFTIVVTATGLHVALGIERLAAYLSATPLFAMDIVANASTAVQSAVLAAWWAAVGAAVGWAFTKPGGVLFATVLMVAVLSSHLETMPRAGSLLNIDTDSLEGAVQMLLRAR